MNKIITLSALSLALSTSVVHSGVYDDAYGTQEVQQLERLNASLEEAERQRQQDFQVQQNIHAIEREQDYQHQLQQRQDKTDYRYLGIY